MSEMLSAALDLARRNCPVFPVWDIAIRDGRLVCGCGKADCKDAGKHPVGGLARRGLKDATTDQRTIARWWAARSWNIGIAVPRRGMVLDVDAGKGGFEALATLEAAHGPLPRTWRAHTGGGGRHVYLTLPEGALVSNSVEKLGAGLDIRSGGGYVLAPPSDHVSGRRYIWDVDEHPDEVDVAEAPPWLLALCSETPKDRQRGKSEGIAGMAARVVGEGARNATLTSLTGHLLRRYVEPHLALELMAAWNATHCAPPLDSAEVEKIVGSIAARELRRREARR